MPSTLTITPPADFALGRDVCSYGYFLLAPNRWDVPRRTLSRVADLPGGPTLIAVRQRAGAGSPLIVASSRTLTAADRPALRAQVSRTLRLDESAETIAAFHAADSRWRDSGRGRLFRSPALFEDVLKTVTSCNVTWPGTVAMNRRLCEVLGARVDTPRGPRFAFPSAAKVARTRPQTLRARCRVGYRDARMVELARLFAKPPSRGGVDQARLEDPATPDDAVHATLMDLPGVGPYAAANIMQLLGRYARLPLDTESVRHGRMVLGMKGASADLMRRLHRHYEPFGTHAFRSYWFEIWQWYESKKGPAESWDQDTVSTAFTGAVLKKLGA